MIYSYKLIVSYSLTGRSDRPFKDCHILLSFQYDGTTANPIIWKAYILHIPFSMWLR